MNKKKILSLILSLLLLASLASCDKAETKNPSSSEVQNSEIPKENSSNKDTSEKAKEPITSFTALGRTYNINKDITTLSKDTVVFTPEDNHYVEGIYAEVDFAKDLLNLYLNEDQSVYNYLVSYDSSASNGITPITDTDKTKLQKNLMDLKKEMSFSQGEKVVLIMDKVTYEGPSLEAPNGITLNFRIGISHVGDTTAPWVGYILTVFKEDGKLVANLF